MDPRFTAEAPAAHVGSGRPRPVVVGGLAVGAVLGFAGNFVANDEVRSVLWGVSAAGLVLAAILLAVEHTLAGDRFAAAGFAVFALGETRVLNPADAPGGEDSFAAGALLYAAGLLLIAASGWSPVWVRIVAAAAALAFAAHSLGYLGGATIDSTGPVAGVGYALLTITVAGWIFTVLRPRKTATAPSPGLSTPRR